MKLHKFYRSVITFSIEIWELSSNYVTLNVKEVSWSAVINFVMMIKHFNFKKESCKILEIPDVIYECCLQYKMQPVIGNC